MNNNEHEPPGITSHLLGCLNYRIILHLYELHQRFMKREEWREIFRLLKAFFGQKVYQVLRLDRQSTFCSIL